MKAGETMHFYIRSWDMSGKYRRETVRHVILLLSALVIALILSFYFSEKVFAAETLT